MTWALHMLDALLGAGSVAGVAMALVVIAGACAPLAVPAIIIAAAARWAVTRGWAR